MPGPVERKKAPRFHRGDGHENGSGSNEGNQRRQAQAIPKSSHFCLYDNLWDLLFACPSTEYRVQYNLDGVSHLELKAAPGMPLTFPGAFHLLHNPELLLFGNNMLRRLPPFHQLM